MKIELLGALDYNKLGDELKNSGIDNTKVDTLI